MWLVSKRVQSYFISCGINLRCNENLSYGQSVGFQKQCLISRDCLERHRKTQLICNVYMDGSTSQPLRNFILDVNVHGSVHRKTILIYIQQDAKLHSLLYLETTLHVSGGTITHHQEGKQLYLQHLAFVTPLLLSAVIVEELELVWVCCWWRTPPTAHSNQFQLFHDSCR
jgi:hypothetical protein